MDSSCLFCRIVAGDLPARRVYEDERVLAFLDIHPVHPGHVLVIPKLHAETLPELPEAEVAPLVVAARRLSKAVMAATGADGLTLVQNNGTASGQAVPHVHFHLVPRFHGDGLGSWAGHPLDGAEGDRLVVHIKATLGLA